MTTDREALVKRLERAVNDASSDDALAVALSAKNCKLIIAALSAQGGEQSDTVSVPREPTEKMIDILMDINKGDNTDCYRNARLAYKAMLAAAKEGKK